MNYVSAYAFAHRKTSSVKRLQQAQEGKKPMLTLDYKLDGSTCLHVTTYLYRWADGNSLTSREGNAWGLVASTQIW